MSIHFIIVNPSETFYRVLIWFLMTKLYHYFSQSFHKYSIQQSKIKIYYASLATTVHPLNVIEPILSFYSLSISWFDFQTKARFLPRGFLCIT